jgi:stage V sporulation protein G
MVEISDVRIFRIIGGDRVKAYANVTLGDEFTVHGVKVMAREDGSLWVSMPRQRSASDGQWRDVFHPITSEARERLHQAVLDAYDKFVGESRGGTSRAPEGGQGKESKAEAEGDGIEAAGGPSPTSKGD